MLKAAAPQPLIAWPSGPLHGEARVPGDKSISHRALILGALSVGKTAIEGLLEGQDVLDTAEAMRALGARVSREAPGRWTVHGVGVGGFAEPTQVIDCGNSGTSVRLIMGAVATTPIAVTFTGDGSLVRRPMRRVIEPLERFGARAYGRRGGFLPLTLLGAADPVPICYRLPVPSAQVKSAVLLAGLNAPGETIVIEAEPTRDHTERMLKGFGAEIGVEQTPEGRVITLAGQTELRPGLVVVPRDPSSAAFPAAAALMLAGSEVTLPGISCNPTRNGFYDTLREMGADLSFSNQREEGGEPVADLRVRYSGRLRGVTTPPDRAPRMIDEFPILAAVAATAEGTTVMRGVRELRVKESDRIAAMAEGLAACGVRVEADEDTLVVHGAVRVPGGARVQTKLDHRIAMSFLCLGLTAEAPIAVDDASPIATSFPDFVPLMRALGARIEAEAL